MSTTWPKKKAILPEPVIYIILDAILAEIGKMATAKFIWRHHLKAYTKSCIQYTIMCCVYAQNLFSEITNSKIDNNKLVYIYMIIYGDGDFH